MIANTIFCLYNSWMDKIDLQIGPQQHK